MSLYDWLLFFHVAGAFLLIGGILVAGVLNLAAVGKERRPSEIVLLYGLIRPAVVAIGLGLLVTLAIGLWLVEESPWDYGYGDAWVITAIVLWVIGSWLGNAGGKHQRKTREMAAELAARDDVATSDLMMRVRNPVPLAMSYASGLVALAILGIMIWKPGA
jgi:predicted integral membrane protein DUF2269